MSQTIHTHARRFAMVTAAVIALLTVGVASPAFAHDELIGSTPAADSTVDVLPSEIVLTFSGVLIDEPGATEVVVTDAGGTDLTGGDPVLDGTHLTQPLEGSASGAVTVIWRVVSSDGHPVSDEFTFTVAGGAATSTSPAPTSEATSAPAATQSDSSPSPSAGAGDEDSGVSPAVWIGSATAIFAALVAVFVASSAAKRRRRED